MKKYAVRNIRLCTKDCICLYVCPTGATDTENSIIDTSKCTGCGLCAKACPSKAISMVPVDYPPQQVKNSSVIKSLKKLSKSKGNYISLRYLLDKYPADTIRYFFISNEAVNKDFNFSISFCSFNTIGLISF